MIKTTKITKKGKNQLLKLRDLRGKFNKFAMKNKKFKTKY